MSKKDRLRLERKIEENNRRKNELTDELRKTKTNGLYYFVGCYSAFEIYYTEIISYKNNISIKEARNRFRKDHQLLYDLFLESEGKRILGEEYLDYEKAEDIIDLSENNDEITKLVSLYNWIIEPEYDEKISISLMMTYYDTIGIMLYKIILSKELEISTDIINIPTKAVSGVDTKIIEETGCGCDVYCDSKIDSIIEELQERHPELEKYINGFSFDKDIIQILYKISQIVRNDIFDENVPKAIKEAIDFLYSKFLDKWEPISKVIPDLTKCIAKSLVMEIFTEKVLKVEQHLDDYYTATKSKDDENETIAETLPKEMPIEDEPLSWRLPDDFSKMKIYDGNDEHFQNLKIHLTENNYSAIQKLVEYLATKGYIEDDDFTKQVFVYRLTGRWRPNEELRAIKWKDDNTLTLCWIVRHSFEKNKESKKWDKVQQFFSLPEDKKWPKSLHTSSPPRKEFRDFLNKFWSDVYPQ